MGGTNQLKFHSLAQLGCYGGYQVATFEAHHVTTIKPCVVGMSALPVGQTFTFSLKLSLKIRAKEGVNDSLALAEGIRANNALHQLELSHNPLCRVVDGVAKKEGLKALGLKA